MNQKLPLALELANRCLKHADDLYNDSNDYELADTLRDSACELRRLAAVEVESLDLHAKLADLTLALGAAGKRVENHTSLIKGYQAELSSLCSELEAEREKVKVEAKPQVVSPETEPLHITHGPLMRHAAHLLRSRKPALPEHESVAAELEIAADGRPTPSGEPSEEWLELARIAAHPTPQALTRPAVPEGSVNSVWLALTEQEQRRTSLENVQDVLRALAAAPQPSQQEAKLPTIKGAGLSGGYVIVTPAGWGDDKAPAVRDAILKMFPVDPKHYPQPTESAPPHP